MPGNNSKLRVALVGCGQIADAHLQEIRKLPSATVVAVCDRHIDLARQAAARFGVPAVYDDLDRMLSDVRPDVLHVTTPPHTHCPIAVQALEQGAHVYLEKPFTVDAEEAAQVLAVAEGCGRLVCVGHDHLFDPVWEECRRVWQRGELGRVVHVDSVQGYDLTGAFGRQFSGDPDHWIHRLPGGVFHNTISHALYKITEFLPDEQPRIWANWYPRGAGDRPTELRVMLQGAEATATLLFSSAARPVQRLARVYGTRQCLEVDLDGRTLRRARPPGMPGPFAKIEAPWRHFREATGTLCRNLWRFLRCDLHYFAGMNRLFRLFYQAIQQGGEPPVPYAEIQRVTAIMDTIFACCRGEAPCWAGSPSRGTSAGGEA